MLRFRLEFSLPLTDVDISGVKIDKLPIIIQFAVKDSGLKQITAEINADGANGVLSISRKAIWKKYKNAVFERIIRSFLRDKNLASVGELRTNEWKSLLERLTTETKALPIQIVSISGNLDNIVIKVPILVAK